LKSHPERGVLKCLGRGRRARSVPRTKAKPERAECWQL
jgi:hypothetical protein